MASAAPPTRRPKVMIVGVDGATFSLVEPRALVHGAIRRVDRVARGSLSPQQKAWVAWLLPGLRRKWEGTFTGLSTID